jgi:hypothetical protein
VDGHRSRIVRPNEGRPRLHLYLDVDCFLAPNVRFPPTADIRQRVSRRLTAT